MKPGAATVRPLLTLDAGCGRFRFPHPWTIVHGAMNWIYQVLSFFVAFGPVILGTLLWHFIWNDDSGSGGGPPGGPRWTPTPPLPSQSGDRAPRHDRPVRGPRIPTREGA